MRKLELILITAIIALGIALRVARPATLAIEHFDEGVYASNLWLEDGQYPARYLYAPPLIPVLIEFALLLFGTSGLVSASVSLLAGCATIPLVWWMARRWFGVEAGLAAAALAALSDFHILFSRAALTDAPLGFCLALAVYLIWEAYRRVSFRWGVAAGVATGLAWWTKYNGWLPLAIGLSGLAAWFIFNRPPDKLARRLLLVWVVIALVAVAVWSPVWFGLQPVGGYAVVQANHAGYYVGRAGWTQGFWRHLDTHQFLSGALSCLSVGVALALCGVGLWRGSRLPGAGPNTIRRVTKAIAVFSIFVAVETLITFRIGSIVMIAGLAAVGLYFGVLYLMSKSKGLPDIAAHEKAIAAWLVAAWFIGLLVSTPLYRPYPRLSLPWLISAWLAAGGFFHFVAKLLEQSPQMPAAPKTETPEPKERFFPSGVLVLFMFLQALAGILPQFVGAIGSTLDRSVPGWQPRTSQVGAAQSVLNDVDRIKPLDPLARGNPVRCIVYVYGEPALFYQLARIGSEWGVVAQPINDLGFAAAGGASSPVPILLVTGPHAERSPAFAEQWQTDGSRFETLGTHAYLPSDFVLLDEHPAPEVARNRDGLVERVQVYRLK